MELIEKCNILVTNSGKKNKIRIYNLNYLKRKVLRTEEVKMHFLALLWTSLLMVVVEMMWYRMIGPFMSLRGKSNIKIKY